MFRNLFYGGSDRKSYVGTDEKKSHLDSENSSISDSPVLINSDGDVYIDELGLKEVAELLTPEEIEFFEFDFPENAAFYLGELPASALPLEEGIGLEARIEELEEELEEVAEPIEPLAEQIQAAAPEAEEEAEIIPLIFEAPLPFEDVLNNDLPAPIAQLQQEAQEEIPNEEREPTLEAVTDPLIHPIELVEPIEIQRETVPDHAIVQELPITTQIERPLATPEVTLVPFPAPSNLQPAQTIAIQRAIPVNTTGALLVSRFSQAPAQTLTAPRAMIFSNRSAPFRNTDQPITAREIANVARRRFHSQY